MAMESPGSGPARPEARWTRPAPPTPAQQLARELIDEDLRAGEPRSQRQPSRSGALARLREWLRRRFSSGAAAPIQSRPERANYPAQQENPRRARQKVAEFSTPELQQVLHAILERIAEDPKLQQAYLDRRLPVVEELLQRTEPPRTDPASQSSTFTQAGKKTEPQESPDPGAAEATNASLEAPFSAPEFPDRDQDSDNLSATVNFAESTAHPATPSAGADVSSAPSNPVTDRRALAPATIYATNVNVTYVMDGSDARSATRPAAVPQTRSASSANGPRRR